MRSRILMRAAQNGDLLAFADDILLTANSIAEAEKLLKEMEDWKDLFGLQINKTKTVFFTNRRDCKNVTSMGVDKDYLRVESFKYLGVRCSLKYDQIRKETKKAINKNLKIMSRRLKQVKQVRVKETIIQAYFRSLVVFHCTPLLITGLIHDEFILNLERNLFKKLMRISNFINNGSLQKWTKG